MKLDSFSHYSYSELLHIYTDCLTRYFSACKEYFKEELSENVTSYHLKKEITTTGEVLVELSIRLKEVSHQFQFAK